MKRIILSLVVGLVLAMGGIGEGRADDPQPNWKNILTNAILMTTEDCTALGRGWTRFELISGRFALAAGQGSDTRGERSDFNLGGEGGEYNHVLTMEEMPIHQHEYHKTDNGHHGRKVLDYGDDQKNVNSHKPVQTKSTGGGKPHNNMPPYLVLNFCHFNPNPQAD